MSARWLVVPALLLSLPAWAEPIRLGDVHLSDKPDTDVLVLPPCSDHGANQDVTRLKVRVTEHQAEIHSLIVTFRNGDKQELEVRETFQPGSESRWIDMSGPARCIEKIRVGGDANTVGRTPHKQAQVAFWGATGGDDGPFLGEVRLGDAKDRDVIHLPQCPSEANPPIAKVKVGVRDHSAEIDRIKLVFQNGNEQVVEVSRSFAPGQTSEWKDLAGDARCIDKVVVVGDTNSIGWRPGTQAMVVFWGE